MMDLLHIIPCLTYSSEAWGAAGWGAHILAVNAEGEKEKIEAEL
mgnify:CR=1